MQFTTLHTGSRTPRDTAKFALVAALHVVLGAVYIHGINSKTISLPRLQEQVLVVLKAEQPPKPPPTPPEPQPLPAPPPPDILVPKVEVEVAPPLAAPVLATTESESLPLPTPAEPAREAPPAAGAAAGNGTGASAGQMHTAVLADAKSCALPEYPARAARNGDSGTTTLALLVGVDGRVTSARVEHSSGSRELDHAAVNALSLCRFKPATNNGLAQAAWAQLAYVWTLE